MQQRLLSTLLVALLAASAAAVAAERDTANVRIVSGGSEEAVEIALDEMKVGESRQLVAKSGKPAIVTRTESGLTIEIAGKRTEVAFPDPEQIVVHGDGKHVVRLHEEHAAHGDGDGQVRKVVVMRGHDGTHGAHGDMDDAEIAALVERIEAHALDHDGDADGDKVIVTRKVVREQVD
jgi:hypothetical protein